MTSSKAPQGLYGVFEQLALCLETPCVPGELEQWIDAVAEAAARTGPALRRQIDHVHKAQRAEIVHTDPESYFKAEQLKKADLDMLQRFDALSRRINQLRARAPQVEPHEAAVRDEVDSLVRDGLTLVTSARQLDVAMRTWLQEAFHRDKGVAD